MENAPGPSAPSEPTVNIHKPLINSPATQGFLVFVSLLPCIISGAILGYTGISTWDLPLSFQNSTWFASLAALGATAGCLISRSMINSFGPRGTMLLSHVICVIGWILTISSLTTINFMTGRVLTGIFVGIVSVSASTYSTECFPTRPSARPVVYMALGVLFIYLARSLLSYAQTAGIALLVTLVSFVLIRLYVPESPAWLESCGRIGDAEYSKLKLRLVTKTSNNDNIDGDERSTDEVDFLRHVNQPHVYRSFLALCFHFILQQFSGPLVIVAYASEFVGDSGVRILNSYFLAVVLAVFLVIGSLVSTAMNHRESTTILSSAGIVVAGGVIALYNLFRGLFLNRFGSRLLSFIPLAGLAVFMTSCSVGLVPSVPVKNTPGEHIALAFSYFVGFLAIKNYLYVQAYLGWWIFVWFAVASALNIIYGVLMFSEPKSKHNSAGPAV